MIQFFTALYRVLCKLNVATELCTKMVNCVLTETLQLVQAQNNMPVYLCSSQHLHMVLFFQQQSSTASPYRHKFYVNFYDPMYESFLNYNRPS